MDNRAFKLAVPPQAECVTVSVDEVRKRFQLAPLVLVVWIVEVAWVSALAWRLDLDEADEGLVDGHGEVRTRFYLRERGFSDKMDRADRQAADFSQMSNERFKGPT